MVEQQDWIEKNGWQLVIVQREDDDALPAFLRKLPRRNVHHLNDPNGDLYTAFKLKKGSLMQLIGLRVFWRGTMLFLQGVRPGKVGKDVRQMPGAFIVSDGTIRSAYRSKNAGDHPDLKALAENYQKYAC